MAPRKPPEVTDMMIVSERIELTLLELSEACDTPAEWLIEMVQEGILEPQGHEPTAWRFDPRALDRARTGLRLQRELGVNLAGAALVLDLLDELRELRRRAARLERQLTNP
ncbi:MAG: chaperone modulator CbpM [Gammaproteobacteria bacterium]